MGLETGAYLNDLVTTNPDGAVDPKSAGDDHLRLIKSTLKATFPGMAGAAWRNQVKAADYTLQVTDNMTYISVTAAATISGTAATLGNGWACVIYNGHTATITIPGSASLPAGGAALIVCTGSVFAVFPFNMLGWQQIATSSVSGAASTTLTGLSGSTFKYHKLLCRNVTVAADAQLYIRLGSGSVDTGSNYQYQYNQISGSATTASSTGATSEIIVSHLLEATSNLYDFEIDIWVGTTGGRTHTRTLLDGIAGGTGTYTTRWTTGYWNGQADRVQVLATGPQNISGAFTLIGYR